MISKEVQHFLFLFLSNILEYLKKRKNGEEDVKIFRKGTTR